MPIFRYLGENIISTTVGYNDVIIPEAERIDVERGDVFAVGWASPIIGMRDITCVEGRGLWKMVQEFLNVDFVPGNEMTLGTARDCREYNIRALVAPHIGMLCSSSYRYVV